MTTKVTINRLATGVPGLDEVLGGGLPEFSFSLVFGPPGCGKTTLVHQIMFALATPERPALYFTVMGEPPLKMLRYQQQFAFFDLDAVNRSVRFVSLAEDVLEGDLDRVLRRIVAEVQAHSPALVFVDSFRSVVVADGSESHSGRRLQHFVQQLGLLMTSWQATTFLIGEFFETSGAASDANPVFTVADGLFWMRQSVERDAMVRKLEVMKMRGQQTLPGLHPLRIGDAGIEVFPRVQMPVPMRLGAAAQPAAAPALTGVPHLDDMLGGGLPRGYSALVAGPSGSGKTVLAAAFLAEGARCGEAGVFVAVEPCPSVGLSGLIDDGRVALMTTRAPDLSMAELVCRLLSEIGRLGATRVVIDSLSGLELALAPTFRPEFRESLFRLVDALTGAGVTLLMTCELEDRYTDLRFSPEGTAFLTDAIIVQRYIEVESRLRRVMAVVKVRGRAHSHELREYVIDADGICVGETLPEQEGLLGGRPRRRRLPGLPAAASGTQEG